MKRFQHWIAALLFILTIGGGAMTVAAPQTAFATSGSCSDTLLTFPAWFKGLTDSTCNIRNPNDKEVGGLQNFIWKIVLNVIDTLLQLVGYLSVGFIIFGGFKYIVSAGSPDGMVKARKTIMNAVIGLVLSIFSVAIVKLIAGAI
jgi:hypothetical protein